MSAETRPPGHAEPGGGAGGDAFTERDDRATLMAYDRDGKVPRWLWLLWAAFATFAVWYVAQRYLPALSDFRNGPGM